MTLVVPLSDRFHEAAEEWADIRLMETEDALEVKAEQALLEVEHLVSGVHEVEFTVEDGELRYDPSDELAKLLSKHAENTGVDEATVLGLHVDLFARVFLDDDAKRPSSAPPK
ncbi:hypothetical protein [Haloprofundus salilacus]|uniref:hypothetical protein n=1 Tax=Haloprofundus salilacus TaxID=2876190 RepID=UPI001CC8F784|nr:hypothetical protein [Haloprofundus salilacus]